MVYYYFRLWRTAGLWQQLNQDLREKVRQKAGRQPGQVHGVKKGDVRDSTRSRCLNFSELPSHKQRLIRIAYSQIVFATQPSRAV